jgi:hypothetical protein
VNTPRTTLPAPPPPPETQSTITPIQSSNTQAQVTAQAHALESQVVAAYTEQQQKTDTQSLKSTDSPQLSSLKHRRVTMTKHNYTFTVQSSHKRGQLAVYTFYKEVSVFNKRDKTTTVLREGSQVVESGVSAAQTVLLI